MTLRKFPGNITVLLDGRCLLYKECLRFVLSKSLFIGHEISYIHSIT